MVLFIFRAWKVSSWKIRRFHCRKYEKLFNLGTRKFDFLKYKTFFWCGYFFIFSSLDLTVRLVADYITTFTTLTLVLTSTFLKLYFWQVIIFGKLLHENSQMTDFTPSYSTYIMPGVLKYKRQTCGYKLIPSI